MPVRFGPDVTLPAELILIQETEGFTPVERKPFSIVLRTGQKDGYYTQGICTLEHPTKGDLELFLVPLGFDKLGMQYEAVFS